MAMTAPSCSAAAVAPEPGPTLRRRVSDVVRLVSEATLVPVADLTGPCRARRLAWSRQLAYWLAAEIGHRTTMIGTAVGGRDHTTVIYGIRRQQARIDNDPQEAEQAHLLLARLRSKA